jgi:hypothetical protein
VHHQRLGFADAGLKKKNAQLAQRGLERVRAGAVQQRLRLEAMGGEVVLMQAVLRYTDNC